MLRACLHDEHRSKDENRMEMYDYSMIAFMQMTRYDHEKTFETQ